VKVQFCTRRNKLKLNTKGVVTQHMILGQPTCVNHYDLVVGRNSASNELQMRSDWVWWTGKYVEGRGWDLFEDSNPALSGRTEKSHEKTQDSQTCIRDSNRGNSRTRSTATFDRKFTVVSSWRFSPRFANFVWKFSYKYATEEVFIKLGIPADTHTFPS